MTARKLRAVWPSNPLLALWDTMVGKKVVMAVTGIVLVLFVVAHMLGNLKILIGPETNVAYAVFLRTTGEPLVPYAGMLWIVRLVLLGCVALHITSAVQLSRMNWAARPEACESRHYLATTYAARTMRWSGVILAGFLIYHLLYLTAGAVGFQPGGFRHLSLHGNVVAAFSVWYVTVFYVVAMACLCLHLARGIWSLFQTLGWTDAHRTPALQKLSGAIALLVFVGFVSVPVSVLAGWIH